MPRRGVHEMQTPDYRLQITDKGLHFLPTPPFMLPRRRTVPVLCSLSWVVGWPELQDLTLTASRFPEPQCPLSLQRESNIVSFRFATSLFPEYQLSSQLQSLELAQAAALTTVLSNIFSITVLISAILLTLRSASTVDQTKDERRARLIKVYHAK